VSDAKQEFQHAVQCHRAGDFAAAEAAYRAILARNPDLVEVYCNLGDTLRARGHLEEAAVVLEHALTRRPDLVQGHLNLAGVRRQQGRLAEAAACLEAALRRKPYLAEAHCNLGVVRDALGQGDRALASFEMAVDLNPRLAEVIPVFAGKPVKFVSLDFTFGRRGDIERQAAAEGLGDIYPRFEGATGFTLLVDPDTGEILDSLTVNHSKQAMRAAITQSLALAAQNGAAGE